MNNNFLSPNSISIARGISGEKFHLICRDEKVIGFRKRSRKSNGVVLQNSDVKNKNYVY